MIRRAYLTMSLLLTVVAISLVAPACWNDECEPGCERGYACFYGTCLSRGFCPANDPNADTCAQYSDPDAGPVECIERVDHGICDRGYVCECQEFDIDDRCLDRECVRTPEADDD